MKKFLMILDSQIIAAEIVCSTCPLASREGQPRWREGKLHCGTPERQPDNSIEFRCIADGRIVQINEDSDCPNNQPQTDPNSCINSQM